MGDFILRNIYGFYKRIFINILYERCLTLSSKPKVNTRVLEDSPTIHTSLPMVSQPLAAAVSAVETSGSRGVREWDKGFLLGEI